MQNLLGKMADLMSSLLPRSHPDVPSSNSLRNDNNEMKQLVVDYRTHLTKAICNDTDSTEVIRRLTELACPLEDKYAVLQVSQILTSNNQSLEELKNITAGLSIIVKYAKHLIRKSEHRREQWRYIHFGNTVVQKKIRPMKGFEIVLQQLGYTKVTPNGLSYPNGVEPDLMVIINLIADMMLFRKEIKEFLIGRHLHPQYIQLYIPQNTQQEVQIAQLSGLKCDDEDYSDAPSTQTSLIAPDSLAGNTAALPLGQHSNMDIGLTPDTQLVAQPSKAQLECNNNSVATVIHQTAIPVSNKATDLTSSSNVDVSVACESPAVKNLNVKPERQTEQLQSTVDLTQAIQDLVVPSNEQDAVTPESSSGMSSSFKQPCTVCGDEATVYCEDCSKKPLCQGCNINWHKHPQRQGHQQKCISVLNFLSPESINPVHIDGAYGISAQTNVTPARMSQKQQTLLVKQKTPNNKTAVDHKLYSEDLLRYPDNQGDTTATPFYGSNQMQIEQTQMLKKAYNPADYQPLQQVQHYQQTLHYPHQMPNAGFDTHSVPYQGQVPYNSARFGYPAHVPGYLPLQTNPGHQFMPDMDSFSPRMSQKQIFDNSDLRNNYHPEMVSQQQQQHTLPYLQQQQLSDLQRQTMLLQQQPAPGWHFNGRPHSPYPYSQDLPHSQHVDNVGPVSYAPNNIMSNSMYTNQHAVYQSPGQMFSLSPQHVIRPNSGLPIRNNQLIHHQGSQQPTNLDANMNIQSTYNTSRGQVFQPISHDVYQMSMPGVTGGHQNSMNSPNHFSVMPMTKPAHQIFKQHSASSSSSSSSLTNNIGPILDQLIQVTDINKRSTKCGEYISILANEIQVLERQINSAMEADVEVCETEMFRDWNRQKAVSMQQKKYLEEYKEQLEDETALMKISSDEDTPQQIHYPPEIDLSVRTSNKKLHESVISEKVPNVGTKAENVPNVGTKAENVPNVGTKAENVPNVGTKAENVPNVGIKAEKLPYVDTDTENVPNVGTKAKNAAYPDAFDYRPTGSNTNNSAHTYRMSAAMLKPSQATRKAEDTTQSTAASTSQLSKNCPPAIPKRIPIENILNKTFPPPKFEPKLVDGKQWDCIHCTFSNEAGSNLCTMCNYRPLASMSHDNKDIHDKRVDQSKDNLFERDGFLELLEEIRDTEQTKKFAIVEDNDDDLQQDDQTFVIATRISGSQEQVLLEKKKAQQEFIQQQQGHQTSNRQKAPAGQQSSTPLESNSPSPVPSPSSSPRHIADKQRRSPYDYEPNQETYSHSDAGSSDFSTPPLASSPSPPGMHQNSGEQNQAKWENAIQDEASHDSKLISFSSCDSTLEDTLARFNEVSMIDIMQSQGAEFAKLIKMADIEGFDVMPVQIAQSFCENQTMGPVEWLKKNWKKNVSMVVTMAVAAGNAQQQNSVGEMSVTEAESAYIDCHGNMKDATQLCVSQRTQLYEHLSTLGDYPREEILQVMFQCCGNCDAAERLLIESKLQPFHQDIWAEKETEARNRFAFDLVGPAPEMCHSFSTSIIFHGDFQKRIKDRNLDQDRRTRMIFVEGKLKSWGRAELVIKILDNDLPYEDISLEDVVEAVRNCQDRNSALAYLQQECALCFTSFPMSKIRSLNFCQCKMCEQCLTKNFEIGIREKHVRHWTCPLCSLPDMNDADMASDYLHFLLLLLQPLIDKDLQDLFETKVRDWHLQKDVSFRWCAHCAEGFLAENQGGHLRMTCPYCQEKTCFNCKKQWEPQHEGLTCEQFVQWKIDNDPSNQSVGLAKHLDENGIDCPTCKMRFALAKGGCMHFKCPQCGHEFCSGCNEPYHQKDVCNKYKTCKKLGLHCHCPRDCFSYLRDKMVPELQKLLKMRDVPFNVLTPEDQTDPLHCPVMEQKEYDAGKKDEKCGKETLQGQAGLCEIHYKEYLVCIINRHELDPVVLMTKEEMTFLLQKDDIPVPKQKPQETPEEYTAQLVQVIQEKLPLRR